MSAASQKADRVSNKIPLIGMDPSQLSKYFDRKTREWHQKPSSESSFFTSRRSRYTDCLKIHFFNFKLWHTEDEARRTDVTDKIIAATKRKVDRLNQLRNDTIEDADAAFCVELESLRMAKPSAGLNTETLGSVIDRLSILSLKICHMAEETKRQSADTAHRERAKTRLAILLQQREDLESAASDFVSDLLSGKKRLAVYRQFKMYNDPTFNPALYRQKKKLKKG